MTKFTNAVKKFVVAEEGATMVEYALMVALVAAALIVTVTALSTGIKNTFTQITGQLGSGT